MAYELSPIYQGLGTDVHPVPVDHRPPVHLDLWQFLFGKSPTQPGSYRLYKTGMGIGRSNSRPHILSRSNSKPFQNFRFSLLQLQPECVWKVQKRKKK